jgi:ADP-ribosyl-[dinitrogen reductase] hydrolase
MLIELASGSSEIRQDLPPHLLEQLENGPFGRRYIRDLDRRLLARVGRPSI